MKGHQADARDTVPVARHGPHSAGQRNTPCLSSRHRKSDQAPITSGEDGLSPNMWTILRQSYHQPTVHHSLPASAAPHTGYSYHMTPTALCFPQTLQDLAMLRAGSGQEIRSCSMASHRPAAGGTSPLPLSCCPYGLWKQ
ncbi:hypothetical protein ACOMHN_015219 [Nucella lapillus]